MQMKQHIRCIYFLLLTVTTLFLSCWEEFDGAYNERWGNTQKIVFASDRNGNYEIYTMNTDGSAPTRLTTSTPADGDPNWSPDGSRIAFSTDRDGNNEMYIMNSDGTGTPVNITNNTANDNQPCWSPDDRKIALYSNRDGKNEI